MIGKPHKTARTAFAILALVVMTAAPGPVLAETNAIPAWRMDAPGEASMDAAKALHAAASTQMDGARGRVFGRNIENATLPVLMLELLDSNLSIMIAKTDSAREDEYAEIAHSPFDPVFNLTWSWAQTLTRDRGDVIGRLRGDSDFPVEDDDDNDEEEGDQASIVGCIYVDGELINPDDSRCFTAPVYSVEYEAASTKNDRPGFNWTVDAAVSKLFAFGGIAKLALQTRFDHKTTYVVDALDFHADQADPFGFGGRRPWTSDLTLDLTIPRPFSKGFGKTGSGVYTDIQVAESGQRRAEWAVKSERIDVLEGFIADYWALVNTVEHIGVLSRHRATLESRQSSAERRFASGHITAYEFDQIKAATENIRNLEEIAWAGYMATSARLATDLARDDAPIFLPTDYTATLDAPVPIPEGDLHQMALVHHPDILQARENMTASKAISAYRENHTKPEWSLAMTAAVKESNATFGFNNWFDSLDNLLEPDEIEFTGLVSYRLPFGRHAAKAQLASAQANQQQSVYSVMAARTHVVTRLDSARRALASAQSARRKAEADLDLATLAYTKAKEMDEHGRITEFELLGRYDDVLNARLSVISSATATRVAQAGLLAALGVLDERIKTGAESREGDGQ
ncbi:MAG: TolC family protein [Pseudomonadota bacterium]|nr:TolC family protein [Pseudomonadota bacterium]